MSVCSDDDIEPYVIDSGSLTTRTGFAGDDAPRSIISTVVGSHDYNSWMVGMRGKDTYIGPEAQNKRGLLALNYPISHGVITDWDNMEKIWSYAFEELRTSPTDRPVLMSEAPLNPAHNRERMTETMFESFSVPAFYVAMQPLLSMYASGRGSGIMLDIGDGISHLAAVYEGHSLTPATRKIPYSGCDVTDCLTKRLNDRGYSFTSLADKEDVRNMKQKFGYVALEYENELNSYDHSPDSIEKKYELPDGRLVTLGADRFRCTEGLFKPDLFGICSQGVHAQVYDSLMKCDIDTRRDLFCNVIISGGSTLFPGFTQRLQHELQQLVPSKMRVKVVASPERILAVWIGGSILASLSTFSQMWITKTEYEETGPSIVHAKCTTV